MSSPLIRFITLVPAAYLLGSVPFAVLFSRAFGGADPRTTGSRNIGATNVRRAAGKAAGALTLAADILKGTAPTYIALSLGGEPLFVSAVGLAAFLGHLFPVFLSFRGGKGVATACGVMAVISPLAVVLSAVVFAVVVKIKRYVSLGSMLSAASLPVFLTLLAPARYYVWLGVIIALFIIVKHRENIKRLAAGVENKT